MVIGKVSNSLIPLIEEFKTNPNLELEGSLGVFDSGQFTSGVDFNHFKSLYSTFTRVKNQDTNTSWSNSDVKSHFASFFYKGDIRGRFNVKEKPSFVKKTTISKCDFSCKERSYDLRVSLKEELPLKPYLAKDTPDLVRLHERWSFTYKEAWRYDFSKVASGTSKEIACQSQPVFEIELELLRNSHILKTWTSEQLAENIIEKLVDLLGRFDSNHKELPYSLKLSQVWNSQNSVIGTV